MINNLKTFFSNKIPAEYEQEFYTEICRENLFRVNIFLLLAILVELTAAAITSFYIASEVFSIFNPGFLLWRALSIATILAEYLYLRKVGKDVAANVKKITISLSIFLIFYLFLHSLISLYELYLTKRGSQTYGLLTFMISILFFFPSKRLILITLPVHAIYLVMSLLLWHYYGSSLLYVLGSTLSLIVAYVLSRILFFNKYRETVIKIIIEKKNRELEELNKQLEYFSYYDSLTGLYNRRKLDEMLETEWNRCLREQLSISFMIIDVDNFKEFNDLFGHPTGDECLVQISNLLKKTVRRESDIIARYGGEEFVIVMPNTERGSAYVFAELLRKRVEGHRLIWKDREKVHDITISIGICSVIPNASFNIVDLIYSADKALYKAKEKRNSTAIIEITKAEERPKLILADNESYL